MSWRKLIIIYIPHMTRMMIEKAFTGFGVKWVKGLDVEEGCDYGFESEWVVEKRIVSATWEGNKPCIRN